MDRSGGVVLLVLDEVQKVHGWSEVLKSRWDATIQTARDIRLLVLGSSALLIQAGLSESLAGRFFLHRCSHWTFPAQILSYNKMLGQLQDVGNTTTIAHYLRMLETAFLPLIIPSHTGGTKIAR